MENEKWKMENGKCKVRKAATLFFAFCILLFAFITTAFAQDAVLKAGVSIDKIPKEFYGTWRVSSKRLSTNNEGMFIENNVDLWNLSRAGNVITLDNPFSGAHASIMVDTVQGRFIKFKKIGDYDSQKLTDTVRLNLGKDTFTGVNDLRLDTISDVNGRVIKTEWASYGLKGEKISGESIK
jgi:hypothetical protein